jgi:hypothetical protein
MNRTNLRRVLALAVMVAPLAAVPVPALAQPQPGAPSAAPSPQAVKAATDAFNAARKLFDQKKFALALEKFQDSYNAVQSPNSGVFIARCHAELGKRREAWQWFERVIAEASARMGAEPKYKPTHDSARNEIVDVQSKLSILAFNVVEPEPTTTLRVGGAPIPREQWGKRMPFDPGPLEVTLETPGKTPVSQKLDALAGDDKSISLTHPAAVVSLPPPPPPPKQESGLKLLPLTIAFGSVGVLGMGLFAVTGAMTSSAESTLEENCGAGPCSAQDDIDRAETAKTTQTLANAGWIIGAVGLAAGATFLIVDLASSGGGDSTTGGVDLRIGPGYAGISASF